MVVSTDSRNISSCFFIGIVASIKKKRKKSRQTIRKYTDTGLDDRAVRTHVYYSCISPGLSSLTHSLAPSPPPLSLSFSLSLSLSLHGQFVRVCEYTGACTHMIVCVCIRSSARECEKRARRDRQSDREQTYRAR